MATEYVASLASLDARPGCGRLQWADVSDSPCLLLVLDADAVHERVCRAGAEIVLDVKDQFYGGRGFTCRDPEGHIWKIGTYDPWKVAAS